jgi:hypothetical protein
MIINETERLCYLSGAELEAWLVKAKEICKFNHDLFVRKKHFVRRLL